MTRHTISATGDTREKAAALRLMVAARNWTGAELRSLPAGGNIRIEAQSDGPMRLLMADADSYSTFPDIETPLFDRQFEQSMVADITLPRGGDYFLIADNRTGETPRELVFALRGRAYDSEQGLELPEQFLVMQKRLDDAFDLRGLRLTLAQPGPERPEIQGRALVVGHEFITAIEAELPDDATARGAILFAMLHAVAMDWLIADHAEGKVLPEHLAAALMILFNQLDGARRQADYFASEPQPKAAELAQTGGKTAVMDPFSVATARMVQRRLKDPQTLLQDMQDVILPRLRPAMLDQLRKDAPKWADAGKVAAAIARRQSAKGAQ